MTTAIYRLRWSDVAPAARSFDPAPARRIADEQTRRFVAEWEQLETQDRDQAEEAVDRALLAEYGPWAAGWRWAASEPGCGGPVRAWCCATHSILPRHDADPSHTVERIVAALSEWWGFLGELDGLFARLRGATADMTIDQAVEHAAAQLLPLVVERTTAEDAWYATFQQVLGWYFEAGGYDAERSAKAAADVISARFSSWLEPDDDLATATCAEIGRAVAGAALTPVCDALADWLVAREDAFAPPFDPRHEHLPTRIDGHRRYIEGAERARDPERAKRMLAALTVCRASAARDEPLTFQRLAQWQAIVLGVDTAPFRTAAAFAKSGRERYGLIPDIHARFEAALGQVNDPSVPAAVRAARVYLDVCFFHPFADGNARAARLAFDNVLTRAGLSAHSVAPIFGVSRAGNDSIGARQLAELIQRLVGPNLA